MARVRLMDNDFNQLCRMRHEMISVMESMRKVPRGEVSNDLVNRYQQRCSNLMSYQQRMIADMTPVTSCGLRGAGGFDGVWRSGVHGARVVGQEPVGTDNDSFTAV